MTDFADHGGYPGVAIAITKGDQVVQVGGYGHDSSGAAVTATTPMPVASVSKSFTALAVMQLVEAGKVALDAPVRQYLPDFRIADPRGARITVRQLLNQTSGISDGTLPEKSLPQPDSLAAAVVRARAATLAAEPGTKHVYTNTNYHLAARLVEVVAGEPFARLPAASRVRAGRHAGEHDDRPDSSRSAARTCERGTSTRTGRRFPSREPSGSSTAATA